MSIVPHPPPSRGSVVNNNSMSQNNNNNSNRSPDRNNDTIRSSEFALTTINDSIDRCRARLRSQQSARALDLHHKELARLDLLNAQHEKRRLAMEQQCNHIAEQNDKGHVIRHELAQRVETYVVTHREKEFQRRIAFEVRRVEVLDNRDAAAEDLRAGVFQRAAASPRLPQVSEGRTKRLPNNQQQQQQQQEGQANEGDTAAAGGGERSSSPKRTAEWQRKPHPRVISKEVADRLYPSPRRIDDPPPQQQQQQTEGGATPQAEQDERQRHRDDQVQQAKLLQEQKLKEKMSQREEHVAALRQRLDESIQRSREALASKQSKREAKEKQAKEWRWKQHHKLRAEAIARLEKDDDEQQQQQRSSGNPYTQPASSAASTPRRANTNNNRHNQAQQQQVAEHNNNDESKNGNHRDEKEKGEVKSGDTAKDPDVEHANNNAQHEQHHDEKPHTHATRDDEVNEKEEGDDHDGDRNPAHGIAEGDEHKQQLEKGELEDRKEDGEEPVTLEEL